MDCILMHTLEVHHRRHFLLSASFGMISPLERKAARTATLTSRRSLNDIEPHAQAVLRPGLVPPAGPESAQMCPPQISGIRKKKKKKNSPCEPCVRMLYESRCHRSSYAVTPCVRAAISAADKILSTSAPLSPPAALPGPAAAGAPEGSALRRQSATPGRR